MKDLNNILIVDKGLLQSLNFIILEASYMLRTKVVKKIYIKYAWSAKQKSDI